MSSEKKKLKPSRVLEIGNIFEKFMDKHKFLNHTGSGFCINAFNLPERDLELRYKNKNYLLTIAEVEDE
jgi:hypothetical protein